jgi:hypothetical protein
VKDRYWLFAYGSGSSYTEATVVRSPEKDLAKALGYKVALRELEHRPGTHHIEQIVTDPKSTGLYALLLPGGKIMVDTHWKNRDAVCDHWEREIEKGSRNPVKERQRGPRP